MIRLERPQKVPAPLRRNGERWTRELCAERVEWYAMGSVGEKPEAHKGRYGHMEVRAALREMSGSKCAYCESEVDASSHLHVEHFRPQGIYPALAYRWDNLLLACEKCNAHHKKD